MKLYTIHTGNFKLDGGAMFGVIPKSIWNKLNPADENNLCTWAMRCLMIEDGENLILIDNGLGSKQSDKFFSYYQPHGVNNLIDSIKKTGYIPHDITANLLTHLHFDHCGGGIQRSKEKPDLLELTFPNAVYYTHSSHWKSASFPNPREKASFLTENLMPMMDSGHLVFIDKQPPAWENIFMTYSHGHTEYMGIPYIRYNNHIICFMADLIPSLYHIPVNYHMGYDIKPLSIMAEKEAFLTEAAERKYILFFEHDPIHECCTVIKTDKGFKPDQIFNISDLG